MSSGVNPVVPVAIEPDASEPLRCRGFGVFCLLASSPVKNDRGGTRTLDQRIKSPLLYRLSYPFLRQFNIKAANTVSSRHRHDSGPAENQPCQSRSARRHVPQYGPTEIRKALQDRNVRDQACPARRRWKAIGKILFNKRIAFWRSLLCTTYGR